MPTRPRYSGFQRSPQDTGGVLTLNGDVTMPASMNTHAVINSDINIGSGSREFTVDNPFLGLIINGQITGGNAANGVVDKAGVGELELRGLAGAPNTYSGVTRVLDGVLALNHGATQAVSTKIQIGGLGFLGTNGSPVPPVNVRK